MGDVALEPTSGRPARMRGPGIHFVAGRNFAGTEAFHELTALFRKARKRARGMKTHVWRPIGEKVIQKRIKERFRRGGIAKGDPVSARWPALSEVTLMIRREEKREGGRDRGGSQPIKRKTLKLQKSTRFWMGQGKNIVRVGSFLDYAPFQEFGGPVSEAIRETGTFVSEDPEKKFYYITGRDDTGKRVRIKLDQMMALIPPRPAIYMNERMIWEAQYMLMRYIVRSFEDGAPSVKKILEEADVPF